MQTPIAFAARGSVRDRRFAAWALLSLSLTGCLYRGTAKAFDASNMHEPDLALLDKVPVVRQHGPQGCGAAALSSLLAYWGEDVAPDSIQADANAPAYTALSAGALRDYLTAHGFEAYLVEGKFADLEGEIAEGRPVLVGTIKTYIAGQQLTHYEVVTGIGPQTVVTMDPGAGYRRYPRSGFASEWENARSLMLVAAPAHDVSAADHAASASAPER